MPNKYKVISHALRALAFVCLAPLFVSLFLFPNNNEYRMISLVLAMATPFLVKMSGDYRRKSSGETAPVITSNAGHKGPGKRLVISGIVLLPITAASWVLLANDFADGGNEIWPLYACVAVSLACGIVWSFIFALWTNKLMSQG